jgi:metallophosphoesterase (TIGR03767 family)
MRCRATITLIMASTALAPAAHGAGATLERTLGPVGGGPGFGLAERGGEPHIVRRAPGVPLPAGRDATRRSLAYFAHLSDLQMADEASPARHEHLSHLSRAFGGFWRPQEAFGPHVVDQAVRAINRQRTSPLASAGGPARLGFALVTGDMADNAQVNEVRWAVKALDGGRLDPFSGQRISPTNPCPASPSMQRRLNRRVGLRRYAGTPKARGALSRWPGALDRAQEPFAAEGLQVPWYSARGNHDALAQGHYGPLTAHPRSIATGCRKVFEAGPPTPGLREDPWGHLRGRLGRGRAVPPDPRRRFLRSAAEFRRLHGSSDHGHGFAFTRARERRRSRGSALYYGWSPRPGLRFLALDTTADAGGPGGNVDHPQYRWLARELKRAGRRRELIVVYGHHPLETMGNRNHDELAGRFDRDPRDSRPLHLGRTGPASVRSLLLRHPNVVLYVAGHKHYHRIWPNFRRDGHGFWQVITGTLAGAPQQSRLLELMENRNATLSIFTTMVDHAAPAALPSPGPGASIEPAGLAAISRTLAWNRRPVSNGSRATSSPVMRNAELVLRDPRAR